MNEASKGVKAIYHIGPSASIVFVLAWKPRIWPLPRLFANTNKILENSNKIDYISSLYIEN